ARLALPRALPRGASPARPLRLRQGGRRAQSGRAGRRVSRAARVAQGRGERHRASCPLREDHGMEQRGLRLIDNPVDRLARTIEALLVIAPAALSVEERALATEDSADTVGV